MARPLRKTYDPANPFVAERHDQEDGSIVYEIWDHRPDTYRRLCVCAEDYCDDDDDLDPSNRGQAKKDADMIATALNMVYSQREFKSAKLRTIPRA
jgi:hypothetical protein